MRVVSLKKDKFLKEASRNIKGYIVIPEFDVREDLYVYSIVKSIAIRTFYNCINLTIYCSKNSYTEEYAKENNIPVKFI